MLRDIDDMSGKVWLRRTLRVSLVSNAGTTYRIDHMALLAGCTYSRWYSWMLLLWLVLLGNAPWAAQGQGLRPDLDALARSGSTFATFSQAYKASTAWRTAMRTSKRTACSMGRSSLCGSTSEEAALMLATAPQVYDARSRFSDVQVVGPVKDQGSCGMW
jgi:hypothetical protein